MTDKRFVYVYIASSPSQECWPGFRGVNCAEDCAKGFYGRLCREKCLCDPCDKVKGCQNITREYNRTAHKDVSFFFKSYLKKRLFIKNTLVARTVIKYFCYLTLD